MSTPTCHFVSLFVADLDAARQRYATLLGVEPEGATPPVPSPHPYSPEPPVLFDLGRIKLAIYLADQRTTHPGDIAVGLTTDDPRALAQRATDAGLRVGGDPAELGVLVAPERHFFEVVPAT